MAKHKQRSLQRQAKTSLEGGCRFAEMLLEKGWWGIPLSIWAFKKYCETRPGATKPPMSRQAIKGTAIILGGIIYSLHAIGLHPVALAASVLHVVQ